MRMKSFFLLLFLTGGLLYPSQGEGAKPLPTPSWQARGEGGRSLFQWLKEQGLSFEWSTVLSEDPQKGMPPLLQEYRFQPFRPGDKKKPVKKSHTPFFLEDSLLHFNYWRPLIQFPRVLKWGLRSSVGWTQAEGQNLFSLSLSGLLSLHVLPFSFIVPFVEGGGRVWNRNFVQAFSRLNPFYSLGAFVSLSILKPSLRHTLWSEYSIRDMGLVGELQTHYTFKHSRPFIRLLHLGVYFHF